MFPFWLDLSVTVLLQSSMVAAAAATWLIVMFGTRQISA